jgi:uncharacterized membrane protein (UPF0127 family)
MNSKENSKDTKKTIIFAFLTILSVAVVFFAVFRKKDETSEDNLLKIITDQNTLELSVELAQTEQEQRDGLMYRTELCENCGMLFVFSDERVRSFWMKNTLIPLDILFISADGRIVNIAEKTSPNQTETTYRSNEKVQYVLELNGGWCQIHNVENGDRVDFSELSISSF